MLYRQFYLAAMLVKDDEKKQHAEGRKYLGEIPNIDKYMIILEMINQGLFLLRYLY